MSDFRRLMERTTFARLLGCAARISQAFALAEDCIAPKWLKLWPCYCDASFGLGFIDGLFEWFPELQNTQFPTTFNLESIVPSEFDFVKVKGLYDECLDDLRSHCSCSGCDPASNLRTTRRYCGAQIAETVILLGHLLSNVSLASETLCPNKQGLELAYARLGSFCDKRIHADFGSAFAWIEPLLRFGATNRLVALLELFTGQPASRTSRSNANRDAVAIWANGITVFNGLLKGTGCETRSDVYVVPGRIHFEGKSYISLKDFENPLGSFRDFERTRAIFESRQTFDRQVLLVNETSAGLQCILHLSDELGGSPGEGTTPEAIKTRISAFTSLSALHCGLVACGHRSDERHLKLADDPVTSNWAKGHNWCEKETGTGHVLFLEATSKSQSLAAIASLAYLTPNDQSSRFHVVHKEGWSCCLAVAESIPEYQHCFIRAPSE